MSYYYSVALVFGILLVAEILDRVPHLTGRGHRIALYVAGAFAFWVLAKDSGLADFLYHALR